MGVCDRHLRPYIMLRQINRRGDHRFSSLHKITYTIDVNTDHLIIFPPRIRVIDICRRIKSQHVLACIRFAVTIPMIYDLIDPIQKNTVRSRFDLLKRHYKPRKTQPRKRFI